MTTNANTNTPPPLTHILETCVYVRDLRASSKFYQDPRLSSFSLNSTTLLLFELGKTTKDATTPGGTIPSHGRSTHILSQIASSDTGKEGAGASLRQHFCFAVSSIDDVAQWETHLQSKQIQITSSVNWDRGGRSIFFNDLDGHVVEIASKGVWPHY
ncbi:Glyoxalase/Bleomycin resistance protein/Dihydroxybiphenyl dioxygenase [Aspergillus spectabilis]